MLNLAMYGPTIRCKTKSMISGEHTEDVDHCDPLLDIPVLQEFLRDDDLQEIVVVSTNFGFIRTFTKHYRRDEDRGYGQQATRMLMDAMGGMNPIGADPKPIITPKQ
jgi:hypothetical protein